ncbi:flavocytochrome c [Leuconostoc koreense]|nr:flavocytochrome c [Leuconostoc mesenteroides]QGM25000.1 flavocytochrome c [Leuconostoc mesenteroides subsp. mesenteroides]
MDKSNFSCTDIDNLKNSYDFVVIGSGATGMAAAIQAQELGLDVVIFEKLNSLGGNSMRASTGMNAVETMTQLKYQIIDSQELFYEETLKGGKGSNNKELLSYFVRHTESAIEWLSYHHIELNEIVSTGGMSKKRAHRPTGATAIGSYLVKGLQQQLAQKRIPLFNQTKVLSLVKNNNHVSGVEIEHPQVGKKTINAKVVLIASGGFAQNRAMLSVYAPDLLKVGTTNHSGATGDGIKLATAVGGALVDMNKVQVHPTAQQETDHVYLIGEGLRGAGAILVNHFGKRFTNEMATRDQVTKAINNLRQDGAILIFDQGICEAFKAANFYIAKGLAISGSTIDELAKKIGINSDNLEETISSWNMNQKISKDAAFDRRIGMDRGIEKSPYYAIHIKPAVHYTMGGIKINHLTEVLNEIGGVVPGLLAAGEVAGGLHGDNRIGGNSIAETIVFGRQAGKQAAKHVFRLS